MCVCVCVCMNVMHVRMSVHAHDDTNARVANALSLQLRSGWLRSQKLALDCDYWFGAPLRVL